ncbi:hypothetical protein HY969_01415 [Candidatus Kaiserbacteria bacterium]|nr:hypothetical protein [Candidatus Kaiserbacteria bacterium]
MKKHVASFGALLICALMPISASAWIGENGWNYAWDDPTLYTYCINFSCNGGDGYSSTYSSYGYGGYMPLQNQYASAYQMYQQPQYQSSYQQYYGGQQGYLSAYSGTGLSNGPYGYGLYGSYGDMGYGSFTGDYIPYLNEPLCDYGPGYGRSSCMYHPSQPLYDYWTGTWY